MLKAMSQPAAAAEPSNQGNVATGLMTAFAFAEKFGLNVATKDPPPRKRGSLRRSRRGGTVRRAASRKGGSIRRTRSVRRPNGQISVQDVEKGLVFSRQAGLRDHIEHFISSGYRRFLVLIGQDGKQESINLENVQEILTEPVIEDFEPPQRYRPENIASLCSATGFTVSEMKRMYRGFKTECPNGLVTEDGFHSIFSKFFPLGGNFYNANVSSYSHYVFSSFDQEDTGVITFEDFALGLSVLIRGSLEEKLRWTFNLYDLNGDGVISKEEMEDVTASVFDLMGRPGGEKEKEKNQIKEDADVTAAVERVFQKMDLNRDGVVSLDEFLQTCIDDETISQSLGAFTNVAI